MTPAGDVTASVSSAPAMTQVSLQDGEIIILTVKPSGITVLLRSLPVMLVVAVVLAVMLVFENVAGPVDGSLRQLLLPACGIAVGLQVASAGFRWLGSMYVLTNRRVVHLRGLFWTETNSRCLTDIADVSVTHSPQERPFNLGSVNFADESASPVAPPWVNISRPYEIAGEIRKAILHARNGGKR